MELIENKFRNILVLLILLVLMLGFVNPISAQAETPNAPRFDNCTKVRLFVLRGSTEDGNFGGLLQMVINGLGVVAGTPQLSVRGIPSYEYPGYLWPKHPTLALTSGYNASRNKGYSSLYNELSEWGKSCPEGKIALLGYSQGAHIVGDMVQTISSGGIADEPSVNLVGATLFADPAFNPKSLGVYGGYDRSSISSWGLMGRRSAYSPNLDGKILSICAAADSICQGSNFTMNGAAIIYGIGVHVTYPALSYGSEPYVTHAAGWLGIRIKQAINYNVGQNPNTAAPTPTPTPTSTSSLTPVVPTTSPQGSTLGETTGSSGSDTFTNYTNESGVGSRIGGFSTIKVSCRLTGYSLRNGNNWWYKIAQSPWSDQYYAPADNFYNNGHTSGSLAGTPFVDANVPICGSAPSSTSSTPSTTTPTPPAPAPVTPVGGMWGETTGSVAHTWTNYLNAGGTAGQTISSNATVQISCRTSGFRVADGNTWWYRIAQSPWNNQFYASADAFYNNGATSGSFAGTPQVDANIPTCSVTPPAPVVTPVAPPIQVAPVISPSVSLGQGPAAPYGYRYAITLSHFTPNVSVAVRCYDSVSTGGFFQFTLTTDGSGNASTAGQCYSGDGPDHWVIAGGVASNHLQWSATTVVVAPPPAPVIVTAPPSVGLSQGPTAPYGYRYAISLAHFAASSSISVKCYDSVSSNGFFTFTLATDASGSASTANQCYSADGPDHWVVAGGVASNHVQWTVAPVVVTPPPPPPPAPTWGETTGSVAYTWTNYSNAGGSQGPTIGSNQTVAISCKVGGFRVADGNTWWYRIAQAPWSNQYFVSADAFYNNGATSGSLHATPFYDPAVPNC